MNKKFLLLGASILASTLAFGAETWSFNAANQSANKKADNLTISAPNFTIDVSDGNLVVVEKLQNKGSSTLVMGGNTEASLSQNKLEVTKFIQNHGTMTFKNLNLFCPALYAEQSGSVLNIEGMSVLDNTRLETKLEGTTVVKKNAKLTSRTIIVGDNGTLKIESGQPGSLTAPWEFQTKPSAKIFVSLSNDSLAAKNKDFAIITARFAKTLQCPINIDLSDFELNAGFAAGNEYTLVFFYNVSTETAEGQFDSSWKISAENVKNGKYAQYAGSKKDGQLLYVTIKAVQPEA